MAKNYRLQIKRRMLSMKTYREEFESAIEILAQLQEQYDTLTERFVKDGMEYAEETRTGSKKSPIVTTLEALRKDILAYMTALGLTPQGAKKLDAAQEKEAGGIAEMLAAAEKARQKAADGQ